MSPAFTAQFTLSALQRRGQTAEHTFHMLQEGRSVFLKFSLKVTQDTPQNNEIQLLGHLSQAHGLSERRSQKSSRTGPKSEQSHPSSCGGRGGKERTRGNLANHSAFWSGLQIYQTVTIRPACFPVSTLFPVQNCTQWREQAWGGWAEKETMA